MELRNLSWHQVQKIYHEFMKIDFCEEELKPWSVMERLEQDGYFLCYGVYEKEKMVAYAIFIKLENYLLLDYFAVCPECRGGGIGSKILQLFQENIKGFKGIIAEVEDPHYGINEADTVIREKRYRFYIRAGLKTTPYYTILFGTRLVILVQELTKIEETEIAEELKKIYQIMYGEHYKNGEVRFGCLPE